MVREEGRAVVQDLFAAASAGDLDRVAALYADDFVDHATGGSRGGTDKGSTIRTFRELLDAFPDTRHDIEDLIAEGDRVVVRLVASGTHTGEFRGIPPTQERVEMRSTAIYRVGAGQIRERWCDSVASVQTAIGGPRETKTELRVLRGAEAPWTESIAGARFQGVSVEDLGFTRFELQANAVFDEHRHDSAQITYVISGTLICEIDGMDHVIGPGDAIAIPGGVLHGVRAGDGAVEAVDAWSPPPRHL